MQKAVIAALLLLTMGLSRSCPVGNRTGDDCGSVDSSILVELGLEYMADIYEPVEVCTLKKTLYLHGCM